MGRAARGDRRGHPEPSVSATQITFRRQRGGWVAHGPAQLVKLGPLEVHKRDGSTCPQIALALGDVDEEGCRVAYLGKGCGKAHAPVPSK